MIAPAGYRTVSRVAPGLYQGAEPPHGCVLRDAGFTCLVLCAVENQPPDDAFPGVLVLRTHLRDDGSERSARAVLIRAVPTATRLAQHRGRALVTCHWGFNRSGLVTCLALCQRGLSPEESIRAVRRARGALALSNPTYERAVRGFRP